MFYIEVSQSHALHAFPTRRSSDLGYALAACGVMLAYTAIGTNMALFLEQNNFGSSQTAGLVLAFSTVGGLMTSLYFVHLQFLFKDHLIAVGLLVMGIVFVVLILIPIIRLFFFVVFLVDVCHVILY